MEQNNDFVIFSPDFQNSFWRELDPDIRGFLDNYESREDWTYRYNEIPALFIQLSMALQKVALLPSTEESKAALRRLIPLLSSMPLRESISAIAWLDSHVSEEGGIGWGVLLYMEAADIYKEAKHDELYLHSKIIYERVKIMLQSTLSSELFCNLSVINDL